MRREQWADPCDVLIWHESKSCKGCAHVEGQIGQYSIECPMTPAEERRTEEILVNWFSGAGYKNVNHYISRSLQQLRYELQQAVMAELRCRATGGMWRRTRATTHRLEFYEAKIRLAASFQNKSIDHRGNA